VRADANGAGSEKKGFVIEDDDSPFDDANEDEDRPLRFRPWSRNEAEVSGNRIEYNEEKTSTGAVSSGSQFKDSVTEEIFNTLLASDIALMIDRPSDVNTFIPIMQQEFTPDFKASVAEMNDGMTSNDTSRARTEATESLVIETTGEAVVTTEAQTLQTVILALDVLFFLVETMVKSVGPILNDGGKTLVLRGSDILQLSQPSTKQLAEMWTKKTKRSVVSLRAVQDSQTESKGMSSKKSILSAAIGSNTMGKGLKLFDFTSFSAPSESSKVTAAPKIKRFPKKNGADVSEKQEVATLKKDLDSLTSECNDSILVEGTIMTRLQRDGSWKLLEQLEPSNV
jgi:hypothetical protein